MEYSIHRMSYVIPPLSTKKNAISTPFINSIIIYFFMLDAWKHIKIKQGCSQPMQKKHQVCVARCKMETTYSAFTVRMGIRMTILKKQVWVRLGKVMGYAMGTGLACSNDCITRWKHERWSESDELNNFFGSVPQGFFCEKQAIWFRSVLNLHFKKIVFTIQLFCISHNFTSKSHNFPTMFW